MRASLPIRLWISSSAVVAIGFTFLSIGQSHLGAATDDHAVTTPVSFNEDIRPILLSRCFKCHGPDEALREANLRLDMSSIATAPLDSGRTAIVAGDASTSELIRRITSNDPDERMPPPSQGDRLSPEEVKLLKQWIDAGAPWPEHWSFVAPKRQPLPEVDDPRWRRSAIDRFVHAKLTESQLPPAPQADRYTLIRRVSLDLIGLPPTPEQIRHFIDDSLPGAYDRLVQRLLDSPRFGERWASIWLDQARYADTKGYEKDEHRTMWPYRDWVIRAFNADMPFDQFAVEQIAGDLLDNPTQDQVLATAFHRNTMTNDEGGTDDEEFRVAAVIDRVNTTMQVWMGLTMGCGQCHSHKYDPISQREYYEFFAFFNQTEDADRMDEAPTLPIMPAAQWSRSKELEGRVVVLKRELDEAVDAIDYEDPGDPGPIDRAALMDVPQDFVWIDDAAPTGSTEHAAGGPKSWSWIDNSQAPPKSGRRSAWLKAEGFNQFFATDALTPLVVGQGDRLFGHVYLDPENPPREVMLQFYSVRKPWGHRAYWGENLVEFGEDGTSERLRIGDLPAAGAWHRLEVAAADVGLENGDQVTGWAFTQYGGRVGWDLAGLLTRTPQDDAPARSQAAWERRAHDASSIKAPQSIQQILTVPRDERLDQQRRALRRYYLQHIHGDSRRILEPLAKNLQAIETEIRQIKASAPSVPIMRELPVDKQRATHVLNRGSFLSPMDEVAPGTPSALHPMPWNAPLNRLGLAQWLVSTDNPLTARVAVNRVWSRIFGTGLVQTEEDFGTQGMGPSHPELLDHLALQFMESNWSLKELCRLIVTSQTYQQASISTPLKIEYDPENRLLSRGARYRLNAEMLRDQALAVAGLLSDKMYGPSVYPPQPEGIWQIVYSDAKWKTSEGDDRYRRALYTYWRRTSPFPSMVAFDAPSREVCLPRRIRTNTPIQAFATLNDPMYVEAAQAVARRIAAFDGDDPTARTRFALELCLCRPPTDKEVKRLVTLYESEFAE